MSTDIAINLRIGARMRLAHLRGRAQQFNEPRPPSMARTWRDMRYRTLKSGGDDGQGVNGTDPVWITFDERAFRFVDWCKVGSVGRAGHQGWYLDDDYSDTCIGVVAFLPHGRILAGYRLTETGEHVLYLTVHDDAVDAAHMADEHARIYAEREQEYRATERERMSRADAAREDIERLETDIRTAREQHSLLVIAANVSGYEVTYRKRRAQATDLRDNVCKWVSDLRDARRLLDGLDG